MLAVGRLRVRRHRHGAQPAHARLRVPGAIVVAQGLGLAVLVRVPGPQRQPHPTAARRGRRRDPRAPGRRARPRRDDRSSRWCFSPAGQRGMGRTSRAGRWGLADARPSTWPPVTRSCGPSRSRTRRPSTRWTPSSTRPGSPPSSSALGDLSLSSGLPASGPELQDLTDSLLAATAARELPCGTAVGDAARRDRGRRARLLVRDGQQRRLDVRTGRDGDRRRRHRRAADAT